MFYEVRKAGGKRIATLLLTGMIACAMLFVMNGCTSTQKEDASTNKEEPLLVRVSSLKGPTSIGLVDFIHNAKANAANINNLYDFTIAGTADEILPSLIRGETDIALIPANAASVVYNKTEGAIQVLNINTLGVLHAVSADPAITSIESLAGRTVFMTGKGTTPEYVMKTLLDKAGVADQVHLEFKSEATELAAALMADPFGIAILPEPYATSVLSKDKELARSIDITQAWKDLVGEDLVTGVTVVRTEFLQEHPEAVEEFIAQQALSVAQVNSSSETAAAFVVELGIIENEQVAARAIPGCNLVYIDGAEMKAALLSYLSVLFVWEPTAVGGSLPSDEFFYLP